MSREYRPDQNVSDHEYSWCRTYPARNDPTFLHQMAGPISTGTEHRKRSGSISEMRSTIRTTSRSDYLDVLRSAPPASCRARVLSVTEGNDGIAVFWDYEKPGGTLTIAQLFGLRDGRISEIRLVFDTGGPS